MIKEAFFALAKEASEYEKQLIKVEADVRKHLKSQFQMKLYLDNLESSAFEKDKEISTLKDKVTSIMKSLKDYEIKYTDCLNKIQNLEEEVSLLRKKNYQAPEEALTDGFPINKDYEKKHKQVHSLNFNELSNSGSNLFNFKNNPKQAINNKNKLIKSSVLNEAFKTTSGFLEAGKQEVNFNSIYLHKAGSKSDFKLADLGIKDKNYDTLGNLGLRESNREHTGLSSKIEDKKKEKKKDQDTITNALSKLINDQTTLNRQSLSQNKFVDKNQVHSTIKSSTMTIDSSQVRKITSNRPVSVINGPLAATQIQSKLTSSIKDKIKISSSRK